MRHDQRAFRPFGDNDDANRRVHASVSLVSQLAEELAKLGSMKTRDLNARSAQRAYAMDLLGEVEGRARAIGVDRDAFIRAVSDLMRQRTGRRLTVNLAALEPERPSPERQEVEGRILAFEEAVAARRRRVENATRLLAEAESELAAERAKLNTLKLRGSNA